MYADQYTYQSIQINSREVLIDHIVSGIAEALTPFERHTFAFIREWFNGVEEFTLQTSGSTGPPKEMRFSRMQMKASAEATLNALELRPGMRALVCLDTRYVAGKMMLVRGLVGQMRMVAVEPAANPVAGLDHQKVDFAALVPYQLYRLLSTDRDRLGQIAVIIVGGAPVSGEILPSLESLPTRVILTYGMTETLSHIALQPLNGRAKTNDFYVLPGISVTKDARGCLQINAGYLPEPVLTNDLVELTSPFSFRWLGRIDNVINSGGVKISPETIENKLNSAKSELNLHGRFIVSSLPDTLLGEKVVCVVEDAAPAFGRKDRLLVDLSARLSRFETPRDIFFISQFPETASGKVDRLKIKKLISKDVSD